MVVKIMNNTIAGKKNRSPGRYLRRWKYSTDFTLNVHLNYVNFEGIEKPMETLLSDI